jgi:hypothetical protein
MRCREGRHSARTRQCCPSGPLLRKRLTTVNVLSMLPVPQVLLQAEYALNAPTQSVPMVRLVEADSEAGGGGGAAAVQRASGLLFVKHGKHHFGWAASAALLRHQPPLLTSANRDADSARGWPGLAHPGGNALGVSDRSW